MSNKFSEQIKRKRARPDVTGGLAALLEDTGVEEVISKAKDEGRFVTLPADRFSPDPEQPRKTFDEDSLASLRLSIEAKGQLQPLLVRKAPTAGDYYIIAGERRWRAISASERVSEVAAVVRSGELEELELLLMQIDENSQREQVPAVENAEAMRRVVALCRDRGQDQAAAAALLGVSAGALSKHLALLKAPEQVVSLSTTGETQDIEVLYNLAKASESDPGGVDALLSDWRSGELGSNLRVASKQLADTARASAKPGKDKKAGAKAKAVGQPTVSELRVGEKGEALELTVRSEQGKKRFVIGRATLSMLISDLREIGMLQNDHD